MFESYCNDPWLLTRFAALGRLSPWPQTYACCEFECFSVAVAFMLFPTFHPTFPVKFEHNTTIKIDRRKNVVSSTCITDHQGLPVSVIQQMSDSYRTVA
jgi:hypothetical protein